MATTIEDIKHDEIIGEIHHEEVMRIAALQQCIYIFVEGECEENIFQCLLENPICGLNFTKQGIVVANYNGYGNLKHALRLLKSTLSHDRPIIITYDDDVDGKKNINKLMNKPSIKSDPLLTFFSIPQNPVVTYNNGYSGGSLEEAFDLDCFLNSCFEPGVLPTAFTGTLSGFKSIINPCKPWYTQLVDYVKNCGANPSYINKIKLSSYMAENCNQIPNSFQKLAQAVLNLRQNHPVRDPNNVDISNLF